MRIYTNCYVYINLANSAMSQPIPASELKIILEKTSCLDHRIKPDIVLSENIMAISCCCRQFYTECITIAKELAQILDLKDLIIQ